MERLRRFNIGVDGASRFRSVLGGVRRKALWVGWTACGYAGCPYGAPTGWLDKIVKLPHVPTCPRGHVQLDAFGKPVTVEEDQVREIARWGLYRDIAEGGQNGSRYGINERDGLVNPLEFFNQGVNQTTVEDKIISKRLRSIRLPRDDDTK